MSKDNYSNSIGGEQGLEIFGDGAADARKPRPERPGGTVTEPAREIPLYAQTDVLVIGGGPAGTSAAIAAARLGAEVILVERYNHLGGLSTGGLVIWIDRMTDWSGEQVIAGFACDVLDGLPKEAVAGPSRKDWGSKDEATAEYWRRRTSAYKGIVTWAPTIDPEALKSLSMQMVLEKGIRPVFHAWAAMPIIEDNAMRGAILETKEGRQAIRAKIVIDTTGDADMLARAAIPLASDVDRDDIHHCSNTAFLVGGVDMEQFLEFRYDDDTGFSEFSKLGRNELTSFEKPFVSWRNDIALFMGPRLSGYDATNIDDLSELEARSRHLTDGHIEFYRKHAPGFKNAFLMMGAPQLGVRHSRRLKGLNAVTRGQWDEGKVWDDEIGVSTSLSPKWQNISVPYGAIVPAGIDGVLGAGRHISCDPNSHSFLREIPQCWMSGQAAGVAGAIAANAGIEPREVDVREIQRVLLGQGAYLSPTVAAAATDKSSAA